MKQSLFLLILILFLTSCQQKSPSEKKDSSLPFQKIVVFGDSYSDNGNVYRLTKGDYPGKAYWDGRFTNGPTWIEYFAQRVGIKPNNPSQFLDFAYGQAQILGPYTIEVKQHNGEEVPYSIPDLEEQITDYFKKPFPSTESILFVVFIGTNDLLNLGDTEDSEKLISQMFSKLQEQVNRLVSHGASQLLIINMRNLTLTPYLCAASDDLAKHPEVSADQYKRKYTKMIEHYNILLKEWIEQQQNITLFDAYAFDTEIHNKILEGGYPYQFNGKSYILKYGGDECYHKHAEISCYFNKGNYQEQVYPSKFKSWSREPRLL